MPQKNADFVSVILDSRIHRVIRLGQNLSSKEGCTVVLNEENDADVMSISTSNGTTKVKCSGTLIPPQTGHHINAVTNANKESECSLFPGLHRVILLGTNISADHAFQLTMEDKASPASVEHEDVLTLTAAGVSTAIPADGSGTKIPPNTGE